MCTPELMGNVIAGTLAAAHPGNKSGNIVYNPLDLHKNILATLFSGAGKTPNKHSKGVSSNSSSGGSLGTLAAMFSGLQGSSAIGGYAPASGTLGGGGIVSNSPLVAPKLF